MTDKDVVERFASIIGVGRVKGPYKPSSSGTKLRYVWEVQNQLECVEVLKKLLPWFGYRRKEKAEQFIETIERRRDI